MLGAPPLVEDARREDRVARRAVPAGAVVEEVLGAESGPGRDGDGLA